MILIIVALLLLGLAQLNLPRTKETQVLDTRIYVNLKEGLVLPSPSPNYLLQIYAHQLYRLLDRCNLADRDAVRKPPDVIKLRGDKVDFVTELFEEALLRTIASWSHDCLRHYGGKVVDLDLATIAKPKLTAALNEVRDKCEIKGIDAALLRIPMLLPNGFSINVKRVGKPNNLFEIAIKSRYCSLKIKVMSYAWSSQVVLRTGPIPMLAEMPISSATIDHYLKLSKINVNIPEVPLVIIPVTEGVIGAYYYHTIVEIEYSRLHAILNSKRTVSYLRYLECLTHQLKSYADWSYRAKLDYEEIHDKEVLSAIKRVEANLANLIRLLEKPLHKGGHGN